MTESSTYDMLFKLCKVMLAPGSGGSLQAVQEKGKGRSHYVCVCVGVFIFPRIVCVNIA